MRAQHVVLSPPIYAEQRSTNMRRSASDGYMHTSLVLALLCCLPAFSAAGRLTGCREVTEDNPDGYCCLPGQEYGFYCQPGCSDVTQPSCPTDCKLWQCQGCELNKFSLGGDVYTAAGCQICPPGQQPDFNQGSCSDCPTGKVHSSSQDGTAQEGLCVSCATAMYSGQAECCESSGLYQTDKKVCLPCDSLATKYNQHNGICEDCPANTMGNIPDADLYYWNEDYNTVATECGPCQPIDGLISFRTTEHSTCQTCGEHRLVKMYDWEDNLISDTLLGCFNNPIDTNCYLKPTTDYLRITHSLMRVECQECPAGQIVSSANPFVCVPCPPGQFRSAGATSCVVCADGSTPSQYDFPWKYPTYTDQQWGPNNFNFLYRGYNNGIYTVADYCDFPVSGGSYPQTDESYVQQCHEQNLPNPQYCVPCRQGFIGVNGMCVECGLHHESSQDKTVCEACPPDQMNHGHTIAYLQHLTRAGLRSELAGHFSPNDDAGTDEEVFLHNYAAKTVMDDYVWQYHMDRHDGDPATYEWSDTYQSGVSRWGYETGFVNNYGLAYANIPWSGPGNDPRPSDSIYIRNVLRVCCSDVYACSSSATCLDDNPSYEIASTSRYDALNYATTIRVYRDQTIADVRDLSGYEFTPLEGITDEADIEATLESWYVWAETMKTGTYRCKKYIWRGGLTFTTDKVPVEGQMAFADAVFNNFEHVRMTRPDGSELSIEWCDVLPAEGCACFEGYGYVNVGDTSCSQCPRYLTSERYATDCVACPAHTFNYGRHSTSPTDRSNYDITAEGVLGKGLEQILEFNGQTDVRFGYRHAFFDRICLTCPVSYHRPVATTLCEEPSSCVYNVLPIPGHTDAVLTQMCVPACLDATTQWPINADRVNCEYELTYTQVIVGEYFARRISCVAGAEPQRETNGDVIDCTNDFAGRPFLTAEFCVKCDYCATGYFKVDVGIDDCAACNSGISATALPGESWATNTVRLNCDRASAGTVTCARGYWGDAEVGCELCSSGKTRDPNDSPEQITLAATCSECEMGTGLNSETMQCELCHSTFEYSGGGLCLQCEPGTVSNSLSGGSGGACVLCSSILACPDNYVLVGCGENVLMDANRGLGMGRCERMRCEPGYFWDDDIEGCNQCAPGSYMPASDGDGTHSLTACHQCPYNSWSGIGATTCLTCTFTNPETWFVNDDNECQLCTDCFERDAFTLKQISTCEVQQSRLITPAACEVCPLGTYLSDNKLTCLPCPIEDPFTNPLRMNDRRQYNCMRKVCAANDFTEDTRWASLTAAQQQHVLETFIYYTPVLELMTSLPVDVAHAQQVIYDTKCFVMSTCPPGSGLAFNNPEFSAVHGGMKDSLCEPCIFGHIASGDEPYPVHCSACTDDQYSFPGRTACIDCPTPLSAAFDAAIFEYATGEAYATLEQYLLQYDNGFLNRCMCALGSFWDEQSSSCVSCPDFVTVLARPDNFFQNSYVQDMYVRSALYPTRKYSGTYDAELRQMSWQVGSYTCGSCTTSDVEMLSPVVPWSVNDNICTCVDGYARDSAGECVQCPAGKYVDRSISILAGNQHEDSSCVPCACPYGSNKVVESCGGESPPVCVCDSGTVPDASNPEVCIECESGKYASLGVCEFCPGGEYNVLPRQTSCKDCPANSYCPPGTSIPLDCDETRESLARSQSSTACNCRLGYVSVPGTKTCRLAELSCPRDTYSVSTTTTCPALCQDPAKGGEQDCTDRTHDLLYEANIAINTLAAIDACPGDCALEYVEELLKSLIAARGSVPSLHIGLMSIIDDTYWFYIDKGQSYTYVSSADYTHTTLQFQDVSTVQSVQFDLRNARVSSVQNSAAQLYSVVVLSAAQLSLPASAHVFISHYTTSAGIVAQDAIDSTSTQACRSVLPAGSSITSCSSRLDAYLHVRPGAPTIGGCSASVTASDECSGIFVETDSSSASSTGLYATLCYENDATCASGMLDVAMSTAQLPRQYDTASYDGSFSDATALECVRHPQSVIIAPVLGAHAISSVPADNVEYSTIKFGDVNNADHQLTYWSNIHNTHNSFGLFDIRGFVVEFGAHDCSGQTQRRVFINTANPSQTTHCTGTLAADVIFEAGLSGVSVTMAHIAQAYPSILTTKLDVRVAAFSKMHMGSFSAWHTLTDIQRVCTPCPANTETVSEPTSTSTCPCSHGYYTVVGEPTCVCCQCSAGYYKNDVGMCTACPADTYKETVGDRHSENLTCEPCAPGTTAGAGSMRCVPVPEKKHTYPATTHATSAGSSITPIVLCTGLEEANLAATSNMLGFTENQCLAIDACQHIVSRLQDDDSYAQVVLPTSVDADGWSEWFWRGDDRFVFSGQDETHRALLTYSELYNLFDIEYARIPDGIEIETCQPDFTHMQLTGVEQCYTPTIRSFIGKCTQSLQASIECLTAVQHNNVYNPATDTYTAAHTGTTQMFRYRVQAHFFCPGTVPAAGRVLVSSSVYPLASTACPQIANSVFITAGTCDIACNSKYTLVTNAGSQSCANTCYEHQAAPCSADEITTSLCVTSGVQYYKCTRCNMVPGKSLQVIRDTTACTDGICPLDETCAATDCAAGHYNPTTNTAATCTPCPVHSYAAGPGATECTACELSQGTHQPSTGQDTCVDCFASTPAAPVCTPGQIHTNPDTGNLFTKQDIDVFFASHDGKLFPSWREYCAMGYACLPCPPGTFEDAGVCTPCAVGFFANNFAQAVCTPCGQHLTTLATGATDATACVCIPGFGA